jgi:hypothetical protein
MDPRIEQGRVKSGPFGTSKEDGFNGLFQFRINNLPIKVIASDGMGWQHVSVSIHGSEMTPSWGVMCKVKDLFWGDDDWVVQFHPAKSEYVNNHNGCLHLWKPVGVAFPKPDSILVGIKTQLGS